MSNTKSNLQVPDDGGNGGFTASEDFINLNEPPRPKASPNPSEMNFPSSRSNFDINNNNNSTTTNPMEHSSPREGGIAAGPGNTSVEAPAPRKLHIRRHSTNYIDALSNKQGQKESKSQDGNHDNNKRDEQDPLSPIAISPEKRQREHDPIKKGTRPKQTVSPSMDFQDLRHENQLKSSGNANSYFLDNENENSNDNVQKYSGNDYRTRHKCSDMGDYILGNSKHSNEEDNNVVNANLDQQKPKNSNDGDDDDGQTTLGQDAQIPVPPATLERRRSSFEYEDFKKDIYDRLKMFETK
ncbi:Igd1p NDAI_0H03580 [Naumovozyma dairenensis CBS 421]|uniref:Uncharacterized protein n=1 Tax=Naumovozyma dairenensis (strain ATCC 10597 / BCRC 20456 / CBS 421 / NBRC 0211 / NRRL Y-12639) TaxID=1071378 RepID=G0WFH0_NAUDC|nr:hypothetical protein NDAI_0H03580 [Naumovozyma dairenensis CBS 421]CCD26531.1 hypothetical protein NDAI_0H03580 [Naumovozyma dairenensis CBS 421]